MKIVSLFAGCGGLDLGFEQAGFDVIWANEYDKSIHDTYRLNHPKTVLNTQDIRNLESDDIPDCDGIIGGPPCQAWSEGGKQKGINDPRGQLFLDYIRVVNDKKPKFFLIENVKGILQEKHRDSLKMFLDYLDKAGYNVSYELLNAADYKIPQDRFRVFFIGIRKDLNNVFIFPDSATDKYITLRQAIGDIDSMPICCSDTKIIYKNKDIINHEVYTGPFDAKYMARNRVRSWDELSFTIQAQARNAPLHPQAPKMVYVNPDLHIFVPEYKHLYRRLSVRECARIQSFPDNFHFIYDYVSDGYKMVGNAVPPRLAKYLALQLKSTFEKEFNIKNNRVTNISNTSFSRSNRISISEIKHQFPECIISQNLNHDNLFSIDTSKNVLICLISSNNEIDFIKQNGKVYYTGKYIPSTIDLSKMNYFMPYIKGKGIRDLYFIQKVRVGSKQEIHEESEANDLRVIFEIKFLKELFPDYHPIHLNIWHTFTDTNLNSLIKIEEAED